MSRSTPILLGFPKRPYTRADIAGKLRANAKFVLGDAARLEQFVDALETLEQAQDVASVMQLTHPA